ncbi:MAG TPA: DUF222 domain-containing protein [Kofleriaceae bacterium]|nr:DUF222 domain-containing protein [Kofleriaceae bacterium]
MLQIGSDGQAGVQRRAIEGSSSWLQRSEQTRLWEAERSSEWTELDRRLRAVAKERGALDAKEAELLREAEALQLWRAFGYAGLLEYMERAMGYSPHTAMERLRVAKALVDLPRIAEALENGQIKHSAVRELTRVASSDTETDWLRAVQGKSLREIEPIVAGRKRGSRPADPSEPDLRRRKLTLELRPETYEMFRQAQAVLAETHGHRLSPEELIVAMCRLVLELAEAGAGSAVSAANGTSAGWNAGGDAGQHVDEAPGRVTEAGEPRHEASTSAEERAVLDAGRGAPPGAGPGAPPGADSGAPPGAGPGAPPGAGPGAPPGAGPGGGLGGRPAYQLAIKTCPDCKRSWQYGGGRDIEVGAEVVEWARCDAEHIGSLDEDVPARKTTTLTKRVREHVFARDGYACAVPGCRRVTGLDLHHIQFQEHGGGHEPANLVLICNLHHTAVHTGKLVIAGRAPYGLDFAFPRGHAQHGLEDRLTDDEVLGDAAPA